MLTTTPDKKQELITVTIHNCARCGGDHEMVVFSKLAEPVDIDGECTHWALCPAIGEPILLETFITNGEDV